MSKKILISGGAGYIGSHNCLLLKQQGFEPITYDNLSTGYKKFIKFGPFIHADLLDKKILENTFQEHKPLAVMHFAAKAIVSESVTNPSLYYNNNLVGTINLLDQMVKHGVKYLIFSSTCATYGDPKFLPLTEDHPTSPLTSYGKSKLMIEKIFEDYEIAYGIKTVSLRYFNAAGADKDSLIGEDHKPETHLIPNVIDTVLGLKDELEIYGNDFDTKDKTAIRDYIHVEDLAIAHVKALEWLLDGNNSEIFNLGTGTGFSVLEIIKEVEKISKTKVKVKFCKRRFGDPPILVANHEKVKKHLNWNISKNSNIENIIQTAYNWHRKKVLN